MGDIDSLVSEGRTLQSHFSKFSMKKSTSDASSVARRFSQLMMSGKVKDALRLLSSNSDGKVLPLDPTVLDSLIRNILRNNHLSPPHLLTILLIHHILFCLIS